MSGFAGLPVLHLSNPAVCICRQLISTLLLEQRWISHKTIFVFLKSNHLHFQTGDIHICQSLLFSSLLINQNPHLIIQMITGNHPRCKWILIPPPYVHSFIWMTMYVPYHKDNISMAGPRGFVKIVRLYLLTTDIWICWFDRFAFVKPSYLHLQTSDINSSFGAALDFSQKKFCIFQVQSSAFSFRWYPHLSEPAVFFTAHQSDFTRPNHFHSTQKQWSKYCQKLVKTKIIITHALAPTPVFGCFEPLKNFRPSRLWFHHL